jgi:N-methylhydantoinase A/oxoprolinase/acetone carboxylase beta subunit
VTDANLLLGRFAGLGLLNGEMSLDAGRARLAFERLAGEMEAVGRKPVTVEDGRTRSIECCQCQYGARPETGLG